MRCQTKYQQGVSTLDLNRFYETYNPKVRQAASYLVSLYRLPQSEIDDLSHAGYIGVSECLHNFDAAKSSDIYNYCSRNMRRHMMGVVREYFGNKTQMHKEPIVFFFSDQEQDLEIWDKQYIDIDLRLDLEKVILKSYASHPLQTQRFIESIVNERSGGRRAKEDGISRAALHQSVKLVQKRLQKEWQRG